VSDLVDLDYKVEYDEEANAIQHYIWADSLKEIPDVKYVSKLFKKIVRRISPEATQDSVSSESENIGLKRTSP
jgi:hypothetical protein